MRASVRTVTAFSALPGGGERYGLALVLTAAAFGLQWARPELLAPTPFLLFLAAVLLASRLGGAGPGWLVTVLSALLSHVFLTESAGAPRSSAELGTGLFVLVAALAVHLAAPRDSGGPASPVVEAVPTAPLLRMMTDAVLSTDAQGRVRFLNPAASRLTGWAEAEALGQPLDQVVRRVRGDTREPLPDLAGPLLSRGSAVWLGQPCLLSRRDGTSWPVDESAVPLLSDAGEVEGALVVLRDASERLRLEDERAEWLAREHAALREAHAQRERLESLFLQAPMAIVVFRGPDHRAELINPMARSLTGERILQGRPLREVLPLMDPGLSHLLDDVYRSGVPFLGREVPLAIESPLTAAREQRFFDLTWLPWRDGDGAIQGVISVAVEVTDLVRARRSAEVLAQELRENLRTRDELLSSASHALKTPLTALQLQLALLTRAVAGHGPDGGPSPLQERVRAVLRPVARLTRIVTTLLEVPRPDAEHLDLEQPESLDLSALLRDIASRARVDAAQMGCVLRLHLDGPVVGWWHRSRVELVITHLLSNALEYGAAHPVDLTVTGDGSTARILVRDHGIGIAPEDQARIFQRVDPSGTHRHSGGFGLGLWLVRRTVESLGGHIHVESEPGRGATFIVSLPLRPSSSVAA